MPTSGTTASSEVRTCGLNGREISLILGALSAQRRYVRNLIAKGKDAEAIGRNRLNLLELDLLVEKLKGEA